MITIELFEGENEFINVMCKNIKSDRIRMCSLESAQEVINKASFFAPVGGYDKVRFVVTISEIEPRYAFSYPGRLDISTNNDNDLFRHIDVYITTIVAIADYLDDSTKEKLNEFRNRLHSYYVFDSTLDEFLNAINHRKI